MRAWLVVAVHALTALPPWRRAVRRIVPSKRPLANVTAPRVWQRATSILPSPTSILPRNMTLWRPRWPRIRLFNASKLPSERWRLGAVYAAGGLAVRAVSDEKARLATCVACVWCGFVLAISFMEAWVKFRAPYVPQFFALDIGRTVFPALNVVEMMLCVTLWSLVVAVDGMKYMVLPLAAATGLTAFQIAFVTPKLTIRGEKSVLAALQRNPVLVDKVFTDAQRERYEAALKRHPNTHDEEGPTSAWSLHVIYIACELFKLASLVGLVSAVYCATPTPIRPPSLLGRNSI